MASVVLRLILTVVSCATLLNAACPSDWTIEGADCYAVLVESEAPPHVYAARQLCLDQGADLASFPDVTTQDDVIEAAATSQGFDGNYMYIGATDIDELRNYTWLDGREFTFQLNETDTSYDIDRCVALYSPNGTWTSGSARWERVSCCFPDNNITAVACMKPNDTDINATNVNNSIYQHCFGDCPDGWFHYAGKCYDLFNMSSGLNSTFDAREVCLNVGADLPSVMNEYVQYQLSSIIRHYQTTEPPKAVYLGLNDIGTEAVFHNPDGAEVNITEMMSWWPWIFEPGNDTNENCVIMTSRDGSWPNDIHSTWRAVNCCRGENISWVMCEKPMTSDVAMLSPDDNIFAQDCFEDIDECLSDPCLNGATCDDNILGYNCSCVTGFTGTHCETLIDYCESLPCEHGATCHTEVNGYTCQCPDAYNGTHCEILVDECDSSPCFNNGTCLDGPNHYNCSCPIGFTGINCETNINNCDNMTCLNNGTCEDGVGVARCECVSGFTGVLCETAIMCLPTEPEVANATVVLSEGNAYGQSVAYSCFPGHKLPDMRVNATITCSESGTWDTVLGACEPHCELIPYVAHAMLESPNTKVATVLNYTCEKGFRYPDNSTVMNITCLDTGNWTTAPEDLPDCEIVRCPELPDWPYQETDTFNNTYNTTVTFWCDIGYVLHDNTTARTIKCLATGEWTARLPPCQPIRCPVLDPPPSWQLTRNTTANTYGTYVQYDCKNNLRMLDGATYRIIKCDATGEWSDNITDCRADRCFPLPFVANATPSTLDADHNVRSDLSCIKGHRFFIGNKKLSMKSMTCKTNGWWEPILAACEPIYCGPLPEAQHSVPSTDSRLYGTVVDMDCERGHYYGDPVDFRSVISMECMDNEEWNRTAVPDCWPIVCTAPPPILNGTRRDPVNFNYSQAVDYECDDGFKFIDGRTTRQLRCDEIGRWNESDVSCRVDRCSPVPTADHVIPDTTNTSWYTNVTYNCEQGYEWPNNKTAHNIICQNDGTWNDTNIPRCPIKLCSEVEQMSNATVNDTVHVYNTYVNYECNVGYKFDDNETSKWRWCSHTALWDPDPFPECEIINCPELMDVENATRDSNETQYNTIVSYQCMPGYQYPDKLKVKAIVCTANETWTDYPEPCEVVFCPPVPWWTETVFNSTDNEFLSTVSYWCEEGYSFKDSYDAPEAVKISRCEDNKVWDPPIDDCLARESIAAELVGVTYESPESVPIGTVACSLMCTLVAAIVLLDLNKLWQDLKMMRANLEGVIRRDRKVTDSNTCIRTDA